MRPALLTLSLLAVAGCPAEEPAAPAPVPGEHGPVADGVFARLGEPVPYATETQRETFARGEAVAVRRFSRAEGLGPAFNVTFCGSCHERPVFGGGAGLYRNFFLSGVRTEDGAYFPGFSAGDAGGVIRLYYYGDEWPARPPIPEETNVVAQRNPIPFFGVGLLAELDEAEILKHADPDDADGDGISGRPNYDRGFVGRFGVKAQTVSIEGFIRGPLFNHLGVTSDPLSDEQKAALPVDSSSDARRGAFLWLADRVDAHAQAAAPDGPLVDADAAPDPELSTDDLFDLVSWAMLLAPAAPEPLTGAGRRGAVVFDTIGCATCHVPRLDGPRGPLPVYSDLLLHDMGPELADGIVAGEATGSEFRTQPLWNLASVGPYLHDGRATTVHDAITWHGGEGAAVRDRYLALSDGDRAALEAFLLSLGGRDQFTPGLVPVDEPIPAAGDWGGPLHELSGEEQARFLEGRTLFDTEFGYADGVGSPRFNGDSCRACHFEPVVGGAGPRGVNVTRHGILNDSGEFVPPVVGTILHRSTTLHESANRPQPDADIFEMRQTPHLFGLGLVEAIDEADILANADPGDADGDGISGRPSYTDGGRLGRFGWKGQVPSVDEFVRDAVTAELGMTLEYVEGLTFGRIQDNDAVPDPEMSAAEAEILADWLRMLAPPPRAVPADPEAAAAGEALFAEVGCASCHVPSFDTEAGPVALYSDLLLHDVLPADRLGIEDASADMWELRTPPLWGISMTAPYLHSGEADTLPEAVEAHDGEAAGVREAWRALTDGERDALVAFLETL